MPLSRFAKILGSDPKVASINTILVANALVWYLIVIRFLKDAPALSNLAEDLSLIIILIHFLALLLSAFIGTLLVDKIRNRLKIIRYWILIGILVSMLPITMNLTSFESLTIIGVILGSYFGVGLPTLMGYFATTTKPENRARLGGIIFLIVGFSFSILFSIAHDEVFLTSGVLSLWRLSGMLFIVFLKPQEKSIQLDEKVTFRSVISNKSFLLYILPWFMFSLVNDFTNQISANYFSNTSIFSADFINNNFIISLILAGASALVCGFIADTKGRKRLALIGFALVGLAYAALGFFSNNYWTAWFYVCADGIAWGAFCMLFIMTIWGDLAQNRSSEKYYLLGIIPYLLSNLTRLFFGTYISSNIVEGTVFSFASFFLFVAILPLIYAPETLSEKILKNLELNNYVNKALEIVKKESAKTQKSAPIQEDESSKESQDSEFEEAKKLAEKYY